MSYVKLPQAPGVFLDDTPLAAEGLYSDADKYRFVRGKPETRGGHELATEDTFAGLCRGLFAWRDNDALPIGAIGTHSKLYALFDAQLYDITPADFSAGQQHGTGGAGWGAGGYGQNDYGEESAQTIYPLTWSLDNWGQNLVANPRGGKIYEWAPCYTDTELVTNGTFATDTAWVKASGWTISAGTAVAVATSEPNLSQTLATLQAGAWFNLSFSYTRTAGALQPKFGSTNIGSSLSAASGSVSETFFTPTSSVLHFAKDSAFAGTVDNVSVNQILVGYPITNAPTQNTCIIVTPEQILMALGTVEASTSLFNPMHIRWTNQRNNQSWTPAAGSQAGFYTLSTGGRIVAAKRGKGEILIWTDNALYRGVYVPDPNVVYRFELIADGCGLIGPNAVTVLSGKAYWMTPSREFMAYEGGVPFELNSTIGRDVAENLALVQGEKVFAFSNTAFGEVTWLYPDARDGSPAGSGIECSRYASYDTKSGELNIWAPGTYDRTAWIDAGVFPYPLATDTSGNIFYQEKGRSFNGGTFTSSLTTAVIPIGNGNTLFGIRSFFPDFDDQQGGMNLTVITYKEPNSDSTTYGPYAVAANATKVDLGPSYPVGRFAQFKYDAATAPSFLRHGQHQIDVYDTGMVN